MEIGRSERARFTPWLYKSGAAVVVGTRRQFITSALAVLGGASVLSACAKVSDPEGYEAVAARTWQAGSVVGTKGAGTVANLTCEFSP